MGILFRRTSTRRSARRRIVGTGLEGLEPRAMLVAVPAGFSEAVIAAGLARPTAMASTPDGRIFIAEQSGTVRVVRDGALLPNPLLSVVTNTQGECGLGGIAVDPNFAANGFVYVYYTATTPSVHNRVSRFTVSGDVAGSEQVILDLPSLGDARMHNGGAMRFDEEGFLFLAVGDNTNSVNAQSLATPFGKLLRIRPDGSIPEDNPFYNQTTGINRAIWSRGLRNPFTLDIDRDGDHVFVNDVGDRIWEEINDATLPAQNFGWPTVSGPSDNPGFVSPEFAYRHDAGIPTGCAVTGAAFYDPLTARFPDEFIDDYFFADHCNGWIWRYDPVSEEAQEFASDTPHTTFPVGLEVDGDGYLYFLTRGTAAGEGQLLKIDFPTAQEAPIITQQPPSTLSSDGEPATFDVSALGNGQLTYQWQRDGVDIPNATGPTYTIESTALTDDGAVFRVRVSNPFGDTLSDPATLSVVDNALPTAAITSPALGTTYAAGDTIVFSGTGHDAEDGNLPASAFTWQIDFHHDQHSHPFLEPTSGITSGEFVIPTIGETATTVWYRITLTVHDSLGFKRTIVRDVHPRVVTLTFRADPRVQILLDGQPSGGARFSVEGMERTLTAAPLQLLDGKLYEFVNWSDGGAATHTISTPAASNLYEAVYREVPPFRPASDQNDLIVVEAEHYLRQLSPGEHSWIPANLSGASGGSLRASPNDSVSFETGFAGFTPRLDYPVLVQEPGKYYVWIRGNAASPSNDLVHVGLDGIPVASGDRISHFTPFNTWAWSRATLDGTPDGLTNPATLQINSPGAHLINLWMGDDGVLIDKILLTRDPSYRPVDLGPAEGLRAPWLSNTTARATLRNQPTPPITVTFSDTETSAEQLIFQVSSSNTALVPNSPENLIVSGSGGSRTLRIQPAANQTGLTVITVSVTDADGLVTTDTFDVRVNGFSEAPVLTVVGAASHTEDGPATQLLTSAGVADPDSANFVLGILKATIVGSLPGDALCLLPQGDITLEPGKVLWRGVPLGMVTGGVNGAPLSIQLNGGSSPEAVSALILSLAFKTSADGPSSRTVRLTLTDGDGGLSEPADVLVTILATNEPPVIGNWGGDLTFVENAHYQFIAGGATLTDDSRHFTGGRLTVSITPAPLPEDRLRFILTSDFAFVDGKLHYQGLSIGSITQGSQLRIVFNGRATPEIVERVLRRVAYDNRSDRPSDTPRTVQLQLRDSPEGEIVALQKVVTVTPVDDAPVLSGISETAGYLRNSPPLSLAPNATLTDRDTQNFAGGWLIVEITSGKSSSNRLQIANGLTVDAEGNVRWKNMRIGICNPNGGIGGTALRIHLTKNATKLLVQHLVRSIEFSTVNGPIGARQVSFTVIDGDGAASEPVFRTVNVR